MAKIFSRTRNVASPQVTSSRSAAYEAYLRALRWRAFSIQAWQIGLLAAFLVAWEIAPRMGWINRMTQWLEGATSRKLKARNYNGYNAGSGTNYAGTTVPSEDYLYFDGNRYQTNERGCGVLGRFDLALALGTLAPWLEQTGRLRTQLPVYDRKTRRRAEQHDGVRTLGKRAGEFG